MRLHVFLSFVVSVDYASCIYFLVRKVKKFSCSAHVPWLSSPLHFNWFVLFLFSFSLADFFSMAILFYKYMHLDRNTFNDLADWFSRLNFRSIAMIFSSNRTQNIWLFRMIKTVHNRLLSNAPLPLERRREFIECIEMWTLEYVL